MKLIKMLGLAALAVLMAMAFAGSSTAMAESTALCKLYVVGLPGEQCPTGELISHVHEVSVGKGVVLSSLVTIECEVLFLGDVVSANNLGNPLEILGHFTYPMTGCETTGGTLCELEETGTHAIIKDLKLGQELADVTDTFEMNAHCGAFINCKYTGAALLGHGLGPFTGLPLNGQTTLTEQVLLKARGTLCPKTTKLDLTTSPLEHTFIAN